MLTQTNNRYTILAEDLYIDNDDKRYIMHVNDMPIEIDYREKMLNRGSATLKAAELLHLVINADTDQPSTRDKIDRLLRDYGDKALLTRTDPRFWQKEFGLPEDQACRVAACMEIGRRFFREDKGGLATIRTAKQAFEYLHDMRELKKEHLRGLYLNSRHRVIHDEIISIGSLTANIVHPREVFRPAIEHSAAAVVVAHNHPSGSLKPTATDIEITKRLIEAGRLLNIDFLDHLIIAGNKYARVPGEY